jgi:hypothetical protein
MSAEDTMALGKTYAASFSSSARCTAASAPIKAAEGPTTATRVWLRLAVVHIDRKTTYSKAVASPTILILELCEHDAGWLPGSENPENDDESGKTEAVESSQLLLHPPIDLRLTHRWIVTTRPSMRGILLMANMLNRMAASFKSAIEVFGRHKCEPTEHDEGNGQQSTVPALDGVVDLTGRNQSNHLLCPGVCNQRHCGLPA